jgi:hypothetical protein
VGRQQEFLASPPSARCLTGGRLPRWRGTGRCSAHTQGLLTSAEPNARSERARESCSSCSSSSRACGTELILLWVLWRLGLAAHWHTHKEQKQNSLATTVSA